MGSQRSETFQFELEEAQKHLKKKDKVRSTDLSTPSNGVFSPQWLDDIETKSAHTILGSRGRIKIGFQWKSLKIKSDVNDFRLRVFLPSIGLSVIKFNQIEFDEVLFASISHIFLDFSVLNSHCIIFTPLMFFIAKFSFYLCVHVCWCVSVFMLS